MNSGGSESLQLRALKLFTESLEQADEKREAWLLEKCIGDTQLLESVSKLIKADQNKTGFLEQPIQSVPYSRIGEHVGAYELLEEIGSGGMGRVYRAKRADGAFEQEVAIKLFEASHLKGDFLERFQAERQILASLEHPAIARLIDGGDTDDGTPFVAMELIRGIPVTQYCEKAGLNFSQRLRLFQQICNALNAAHQRGIVHRDIKPGNVLVTESGQPKIIDFGISKVLESAELDLQQPKTSTQFRALTPEYASPEQILGQAISPATDVYSLGILLYEMLTGMRPYQLSTLTPAEVERTICQTVPQDPSQLIFHQKTPPPQGLSDASSLRRSLRGDVDKIVMTALRKEPEQRYASAAEFAEDIERHLSGQPVAARGASRWYRSVKFSQRHRAAVFATFAIFCVLLTALVMVSRQAYEAKRQAEQAVSAKEFLIQLIAEADPFASTESPTIADAIRRAIPRINEQFAGQPELEAEMHYAIGYSLVGLGDHELATEQLLAALEWYREFGNTVGQARSLMALGQVAWGESDFEESEALYEAGLVLVEADSTLEGKRVKYDIVSDLAGLMPKMDRYQEGVDLAMQALATMEEIPDVPLVNQAISWNNLAVAYDGLENFDQSIQAYEQSIKLHRQANDAHPDLAIALSNLGLTYELSGDMASSVAMVEEATDMQRQMLGESHPQYLLALYNLGSLQVNAGDLVSATKNLNEVVQKADTVYSENHLYTARFNLRLAEVYLSQNQPENARRHLDVAKSIYAVKEEVSERWKTTTRELIDKLEGPQPLD